MAGNYDGEIIINTKLKTDGFDKGTTKMKAGSRELEDAIRNMADSMKGIGENAQNSLNKAVTAFAKQNAAYEKQKQKVEVLKQKLDELQGQKVATDEWNDIQAQIDKATQKINTLTDQQDKFLADGGKTSSSAYQKRASEIELLKEEISECEKEQNLLLDNGGAYKPVDTSALSQQIEAEQDKLRLSNDALQNSVDGVTAKIRQLASAESESASSANAVGSAQSGFAGKLSKIGSAAGGAMSKVGMLAKSGLGALGNGLKKISSHALNGAKSLLHLGKSSGSATDGFKHGIKTLMKYAFGIKTLFILVRKLKDAIKDGLNNLVKADSETNKSISSIMNSLNQLKNSLATAFAPVINAVAPIITKFIGYLTKAVNAIGKFFAALRGQSTYKQAQMGNEDYAKSLDKTAKSAKKANKENQKYKSGLDEMATFDDKSSDGSDSDSGSGVRYQDVAIDESIGNLVQRLKDLIKADDWEGLGKLVAEKLNNALKSIPWGKIQKTVKDIVSKAARFLNGFFSDMDLANTVGVTLAEALNTGLIGAYTFLTTFDFKRFGTWIGTAINGAIKTFRWGMLGDTIGAAFQGIIDTALGIFTSYNWGSFAAGLADTVNHLFSSINFGEAAQVLSMGLVGIFTEASTFLHDVKWEGIGQDIGTFLVNIDWIGILESVLVAIGNAVRASFSLVAGLIEGLFSKEGKKAGNRFTAAFDKSVEKIKEVYKKYFKPFVDTVLSGVSEIAQKAVPVIQNIIDTIVKLWNIIKPFVAWITDYLINLIMSDLTICFNTIKEFYNYLLGAIDAVIGCLQGLIDFYTGVFTGDLDKAIGGVKKMFGNLIKFIKNIFGAVITVISMPFKIGFNTIKNVWNAAQGYFKTIWQGIKNVFSTVKEFFGRIFKGAWNTIKNAFSNPKAFFVGIWNGIKSAFSHVTGWFKDTFSKAWAAVKGVFSKGGKIFKGIKEGIAGVFKTVVNALIGGINKIVAFPFKKINSMLNTIHDVSILGIEPFSGLWDKDPLPVPQIPKLATGAVIPPRSEFMAILGDQKRGNNIETPEALLRKIIREESGNKDGNSSYEFVAQINRRTLFDEMVKEAQLRKRTTGKNPLMA